MRSFLRKYRSLLLVFAFVFVVIPCVPDAIKSGKNLIMSFSKEPVRTVNILGVQLGGDPIVASFPEGIQRDLVRAIAKGNLQKVKDLVGSGANVNAKGEYSLTPLYATMHFRQPEIFEYLLEQGADYHVKTEMKPTIRSRFRIRLVSGIIASVALDDDSAYLRALLKFATPLDQEELFMTFIEWPAGSFRLPTAQQLSPKDHDCLDREKIDLFKKASYQCKPIGAYPRATGPSRRFYMWSELFQAGFPFSDDGMSSLANFFVGRRYEGREQQMFQDYPGMDEFCETVDSILPGTVDKIKSLVEKEAKVNDPEVQAEFKRLATEFSRAQLKRFDSLRKRVEEERKANRKMDSEQTYANIETLPEPGRSEMKVKAGRMFGALVHLDTVAVLNLLDRGAPVNGTLVHKETPLDIARRKDFPEMCQILVNAGAVPSPPSLEQPQETGTRAPQ